MKENQVINEWINKVKNYILSSEELKKYQALDIKPYPKPCTDYVFERPEVKAARAERRKAVANPPDTNQKKCQYCGKVIQQGKTSNYEYEKQKCCNQSCANRKRYNLPQVIPETKKCKVCGKVIHKPGYQSITAWMAKDTCTLLCGTRQGNINRHG